MPLVGMLIGNQISVEFQFVAEWLGPVILIALGLYILISELLEKESEDLVNKRWMILTLPFVMSLDNLMAGIGLGTTGYPIVSTSVIIGVCAGTMCLVGLLIGEKMRKLLPSNIEVFSGFYLIGLAVFLIIID